MFYVEQTKSLDSCFKLTKFLRIGACFSLCCNGGEVFVYSTAMITGLIPASTRYNVAIQEVDGWLLHEQLQCETKRSVVLGVKAGKNPIFSKKKIGFLVFGAKTRWFLVFPLPVTPILVIERTAGIDNTTH
jgi:hypothetical protein